MPKKDDTPKGGDVDQERATVPPPPPPPPQSPASAASGVDSSIEWFRKTLNSDEGGGDRDVRAQMVWREVVNAGHTPVSAPEVAKISGKTEHWQMQIRRSS